MQLETLAGRDPQRPVGIAPTDVVHHQILLRCQLAPRQFQADHEHVNLAHPCLIAILAGIAVFLLVTAVKLQ